jgi:large subunit ribosomal protein L21
MYAVIETGGKQYRVEVGTELEVELLDEQPGATITIERVLLVADGDESTIGRPLVGDATVSAEVMTQTRGPKLISFKYKPKARSRVKKGHRQELTVLRIADITLNGKSAAKSARKAEDAAKTERQRLADAAATQAAKDAELAAKLAVGVDAEKKPKAKAAPRPKAKDETETKAEPKADAEAKADGKARATPKSATTAKAGTKTTAAKATSAKADTDAPKTKADAPKRTRATKKDE